MKYVAMASFIVPGTPRACMLNLKLTEATVQKPALVARLFHLAAKAAWGQEILPDVIMIYGNGPDTPELYGTLIRGNDYNESSVAEWEFQEEENT